MRFLAADVPCGWITHRVNFITGEEIPVERWVNHIHPEDWEWFERAWDEEDAWDYYFEAEMARERKAA